MCLVRGYPRLSEGYPRLSHDYRNSPCFFLMFESFVVPEMSFPDQSTGLEFSLSVDNFRTRKSQHVLRDRYSRCSGRGCRRIISGPGNRSMTCGTARIRWKRGSAIISGPGNRSMTCGTAKIHCSGSIISGPGNRSVTCGTARIRCSGRRVWLPQGE